jgi:hypothetical protein
MLFLNRDRPIYRGFFVPLSCIESAVSRLRFITRMEIDSMRQKQGTSETLQPIDDGLTYPMATFMRAAGWGRHALKQARQQGLKVVKVSGRCFVRGRDFSEFLGSLSDQESPP